MKVFMPKTGEGAFTHVLVLFKGTAHLDPLLSAGFGASMPVLSFFFDLFSSFLKRRFQRLSAGFGVLCAGFGGVKCRFCREKKQKIQNF